MRRKIVQFGFETTGSDGDIDSTLWVLDDSGQLWYWRWRPGEAGCWRKSEMPHLPAVKADNPLRPPPLHRLRPGYRDEY